MPGDILSDLQMMIHLILITTLTANVLVGIGQAKM